MTGFRFALFLGVVLVVLGIGRAPSVAAQPSDAERRADTLTADGAVRRALDESATVRAVRQKRVAAAASVQEARADWFPVVEGQAQYRRLSDNVDYTVDLPSIPGSGNQSVTFAPAILDRYSVRATVEQPLFTGFRVANQLDAAQAQADAARAQVEATRNEEAFATREAYWRLYEARAREQAAADALRQIERQLTDVRNRREAGMATETDVLRVRARRDRVRVERLQAQNAVQTARHRLNDHIGRPLDAPVVLADTVTVDSVAYAPAALVQRATEQRPDLRALRQTVEARAAEVDVAQSGWFPQVALTGSYLYARPNEQLFPPEDRFQGTWDAGVSLTWRLSTGGGTDAATDRAQARRLKARYELQDRRRAVSVEVRTQVQNVEQARRAVRAAETSLQSARAAYRSVQSRAEAGTAVVSDLLDAERALREARAQLAAAQVDYALAQAALDRALGEGVPDEGTAGL
jgi:TolC family type I secretion outer membrane protein